MKQPGIDEDWLDIRPVAVRIWDDVVNALPEKLRIIRYDSRGHGLSDCPDGEFDVIDLADDLVALLDHLNIKKCVLVGLSIGGKVGQHIAYKYPDRIAGLVLTKLLAGAMINRSILPECPTLINHRDTILLTHL